MQWQASRGDGGCALQGCRSCLDDLCTLVDLVVVVADERLTGHSE